MTTANRKKKEEKRKMYRIWYNDSEPSGDLIDMAEKEEFVKKEIKKYLLFIISEGGLSHFYINGNISEAPPGKLSFKILCHILKNKGCGGTALHIARHIYQINDQLFYDLRELAKTIKQYPVTVMKKEKMQLIGGNYEDQIDQISNKVRSRIKKLNDSFLSKLGVRLSANNIDEYVLFPHVPKYCLIEKIFCF